MVPILIRPLMTEKSLAQAAKGWYTFIVGTNSTKAEISLAIQKEFKVNATKIRTVSGKAKLKRSGRKRLLTKSTRVKKALVKLKKGEKIGLFETHEVKK